MESSIAEFVERQLACELLPTEDQAPKASQVLRHLKKRLEVCACLARKKFRGLRVPASWHACMSCAVVCMFQARVQVANAPTRCTWFACSGHEFKLQMLRHGAQRVGSADSSRLAMQWCACSVKHIRVMQRLHVPGTELLRVQVANAPTPIRCRQCTCHLQTRSGNLHPGAYLLGLLAMIKCSICSYQCDN